MSNVIYVLWAFKYHIFDLCKAQFYKYSQFATILFSKVNPVRLVPGDTCWFMTCQLSFPYVMAVFWMA